VEVVVDGTSGWGEVTAGETPAYNAETRTLLARNFRFHRPFPDRPSVSETSELPRLMAQIRGHEMAKSGVENAMWATPKRNLRAYLSTGSWAARWQRLPAAFRWAFAENPASLVKRVEEELRERLPAN